MLRTLGNVMVGSVSVKKLSPYCRVYSILLGIFRGREARREGKKCSASVMVGEVRELDSCSPIVKHVTQLQSLILTFKNTIQLKQCAVIFQRNLHITH